MSAAPTDLPPNSATQIGAHAIDLTEPFLLGDWRIDPALRTATSGESVVKIDPRNMRVLQTPSAGACGSVHAEMPRHFFMGMFGLFGS